MRARQRTRKGACRIEIEPFALQLRFEAGAAPGRRSRERNPSLDGAAVDLRRHGLEREATLGHADIAAQAQRFLAAIDDFAAALQPSRQCIRVRRFDAERAGETAGRTGLRMAAAQRHQGRAGGAKIQPVDAPGFGVGPQIGGQVLHRTAAQHDLLGAELDPGWNRRLRHACQQRAQPGQ